MDLKEFNFPEVTEAQMIFPTAKTDPDLLAEAGKRGFYNGNTPYNNLFSTLFFNGGKVVFRKDVDDAFIARVWPYLQAFMGSWEPKHEEKEAICAMLLSETVEPEVGKPEKGENYDTKRKAGVA